MSDFEAMVNAHLGAAQRKQASVELEAGRKRDYLDPVFEFNVNDVNVLDQDTVVLPSGEPLRFSAGDGRTLDAYETEAQRYADRPETFERHRQNFARAYGVDPEDVTVDDLVVAGQTQKAKARDRLLSMADENGHIRYRRRGQDKYNRTLAEVDPDQVNLSGRRDNAAYYSPFNYEQTLADFESGERADQLSGAGDRSLKTVGTDQVVNFAAGAGRMANDLVQGAGTLIGVNNIPGVDRAHSAVRSGLESFKEAFNSPQQLRRERLEQERAEDTSEFFNVQRDKYLKDGAAPLTANIRAGIDEFTDAVGNVIENPGSILDKTVESLPYMLGVAGAGRAATTKAIEKLQQNILKQSGTARVARGNVRGAQGPLQEGALETAAIARTNQFLSTRAGQDYLKRVQRATGVTTVGLTEGLSTAAEVYDSVANMTEEQAQNSEKYLGLRRQGMSHEKAVQELAEDAHLKTLMSVSLAAGAASWITGAGTFEAQLFTGLGSVRKKAATAVGEAVADVGAKKTGLVKGALKLGYKGTKAVVKALGPGASKEGAEELLQSGGGEFLSQLAKFEATGEQVGPGVGRAAGEGFVIGAASGGIAEATLGSLKRLGQIDAKALAAKANDYAQRTTPTPQNAVAAATGRPTPPPAGPAGRTGTPAPAPVTLPPSIDSPEVTADPVKAYSDEFNREEPNTVLQYTRLETIKKRLEAQGAALSPEASKIHEKVKTIAIAEANAALEDIRDKKTEDITQDDLQMLSLAGQMGIRRDMPNLSPEQRSVFETSAQLAEDLNEAAALREQQVALAPSEAAKRTIRQVWDNKFGDVEKGTNGRPGLGWYERRMRELMNTTTYGDDNPELQALMTRFKKFRTAENNYLEAARRAVREQRSVPILGTKREFKYTAPSATNSGGSQALLEILESEQTQFDNIRNGLLKRYDDWTKASTRTKPVVRSAATAEQQAAVDKRDASARKAAAVGTKDQALRDRVQAEVIDGTGVGTSTRRVAIVRLMKDAQKSKDRGVVAELRALNRANKKAFQAAKARGESDVQFAEVPESPIRGAVGAKGTVIPGIVDEGEASPAPVSKETVRTAIEKAATEGKGAQTLLQFIQANTKNKAYQALAERLLGLLGERGVRVIPVDDAAFKAATGGRSGRGVYIGFRGKNEGHILLNQSRIESGNVAQSVILHEAIHAVIDGHIKDGISPALKKRLYTLNLQVVRALTNSDRPLAAPMARILASNPEELLTHGITTPFLQDFLKEMQIDKQSAWDKFVKLIADLLGVKDTSALGEVLAITESIFQEVAAKNTPAAPEAKREPEPGAERSDARGGGEPVAEGVSSNELEAKAALEAKGQRIAEVKRQRTMLKSDRLQADAVFLNDENDMEMFRRLTTERVPAVQALEQVLARIEPNPAARDVTVAPTVPVDVINATAANAAQLNGPDAKALPAKSFMNTLWNYALNLKEGAVDAWRKAFGDNKLGLTAADNWEVRSDRIRDLLASEDQIMEILTDPASRELFFDKAGTTPAEERALRTFANFYTRFAEVLNSTLESERPIDTAAARQATKNPLYFFRDRTTGKIHSNVAGAMALEAMQYLVGAGAQSIRNTDDDIRAILGLEEWATLDSAARATLGRGTLQTNMTQEIGRKVYSHLNLKLKESARPLGDEALMAAIGAQTLAVLTQLGTTKKVNGRVDPAGTFLPRVERIRISRARWNQLVELHSNETSRRSVRADLRKKFAETANAEGDIILVANKLDDSEFDSVTGTFPEIDVNARMRDAITEGRDIFQRLFSSTASQRTPMFRKPTLNDIPTKVLRSISKVPKIIRERLLHDAQQPWAADVGLLELMAKFGTPEQYLRMVHSQVGSKEGFLTDAEVDQLHAELRDGARGRNLGYMRDLTDALRWGRQYGARKFYLPMKMARNGRFLIDSNVINPQASKLHRFMFTRQGWARAVTKGELTGEAYNGLMMAIGMGIGLKTDVTAVSEIVRQVEDAFTQEGDWRTAMQVIQTAGDKFTPEQLADLGKVLSGAGTHAVAALRTAAQWFGAADGEKLTLNLPHEIDGVTNGYILGLLMTPPAFIDGAYKRLLNAGGVYFAGDPWRSLAEYKAAGNLDNYQQIAQDSRAVLSANEATAKAVTDAQIAQYAKARAIVERIPGRNLLIQKATSWVAGSGLVPSVNELDQLGNPDKSETKEGRKWAKDPLLVMAYGAGFASVGRQVVSNALEKFYGFLGDTVQNGRAPDAEVIAAAMNRAFKIINMVALANNRTNVPKIINDPETGETKYLDWPMQLTSEGRFTLTAADVQRLADQQFGGSLFTLATEFRLSPDQRTLLTAGLNTTYGQALQSALEARLRPVLEVRGRMNAANQLANMMYVAEYDRQIQALVDSGVVVTSKHKQDIQQDLMNQGLVPTIATAASEGIADSLEMTNSGNEYMREGQNLLEGVGLLNGKYRLSHQYLGLNGQTRAPEAASSITARFITRVPDADVGVAAFVKSVHGTDGVIGSQVWGQSNWPVLNVHDATVSPWFAATNVGKSAQIALGDTLGGYDVAKEFSSMLNRIMGSLWHNQDSRLSKEVRDDIALKMAAMEEVFGILSRPVPVTMDETEKGYLVIDELRQELEEDQQRLHESRTELFRDVRWINQFAQEDTTVFAPKGIDLKSPTGWSDDAIPTTSLEEQLVEVNPVFAAADVQLSEEFENQREAEKAANAWSRLAELEAEEINPAHGTHLRNLVQNVIAPGLQTLDPIFQEHLERVGPAVRAEAWIGDLQRMTNAGAVLTSTEDMTLQERAAQEYVSAIVHYGVQTDHFVRKEVRRLFELAQSRIGTYDFMPLDATGDLGIASQRAQERYDYIFSNEDPNTAYERFLAIGLTNQPFIEALSRIDNADAPFVRAPDWSKGILAGMMSLFRQIVEKITGTGARYTGGTVSDALQALVRTTIGVNVRNQQRLQDLRTGVDGTSRVQRVNQRLVNAINDRFVEPLAKGLAATNAKRLDPKNPTLPGFIKTATYTALASRDTAVRDEYNRFYREITSPYNIGKDNAFFETLAEVAPWKEENLNWIGLLRKSKYIVDMARQEVSDHTRTFINKSFDPLNYMSKAHKMAITNVILKTDLSSLLDRENNGLDLTALARLLVDSNARETEQGRLESMLRAALAVESQSSLFFLFQNQARSLANFMVKGETTVENGMLNAHNIVKQFMLHKVDRAPISDPAVESIVDRLATIYALNQQSGNDLRLTNQIVQHEMNRTNLGDENGFSRLVGMHINFKMLARQKLFDDDPVQMIKGYVYEIFDGDVNVEYVEEGSEREQELIAQGMTLVGPLPKDSHDDYKGRRLLYKGLRGLNTYNKSIVSLTDLQHRGANLFSTNGFQSANTRSNLARSRNAAYVTARRQLGENFTKAGANMVPVLNSAGDIVDYRYMMSESNKRAILKKEDPFDRVLPRMFASISDRSNSKTINRDVVRLLRAEYTAGRNDPGLRFVKVALNPDPSATPKQQKASRDMWNLLPEDMRREAEAAFGEKAIYVRDEVVNLVLGFRKMTVTNIQDPDGKGTIWGRATPVVRIAEKIWLEIVQLMRIKIAILTPAIVVGNIASNTAMLLSEGIPVDFIRKNASEAISGMRQYQKDRQAATELAQQIGAREALGQDTRALRVRLARLEADLTANPVAQLVADGLFTSITADLGVDDDTIRGSLLQKAEDFAGGGGRLGKGVMGVAKELYMLPGSKGFQAAIAATQYGDFVGRYIKFKYDTQVNKKGHEAAINEALAAFIYYDLPQPKYLQALNDTGLVMFTKFFLRIQHIVARMYTQNPISAFSILGLQKALLPNPFHENIMDYGMGDGLTNKWNNPLNLPGKVWNTLNPTEPALLQWILNPFGL